MEKNKLFFEKKENIINEIQTQIKEDLNYIILKMGLEPFRFRQKLITLINKHSETEEGRDLIDKAFKDLPLKNKDEIDHISMAYSEFWYDGKLKLKYVPDLGTFEKIVRINFSDNYLTEIDVKKLPPNLKHLNVSGNPLNEKTINDLKELEKSKVSEGCDFELKYDKKLKKTTKKPDRRLSI